MIHGRFTVRENVPIARDTFRLRIGAPDVARSIVPGQFVMLRLPDRTDPLLGRAFALYDTFAENGEPPCGIDLVYLVVGRMTRAMSCLRSGDTVELWGPLGNCFPPVPPPRVLLVAGGIGQTPFLALAKQWTGRQRYGAEDDAQGERRLDRETIAPDAITLCYGVRTAAYFAGLDDFRRLGIQVQLATDDGSTGHHGFVTDLVEQNLRGTNPPDLVVGCGPEPMLHALGRIVNALQVPALLSLESPMACGFGACFSCVTSVRQPDGVYDYRRICVEGPIFTAADLSL